MAFGDSLTAGYCLTPADSFAARLEAVLRESWPAAEVQNAGISGDTSEAALRRLPPLLAALRHKPDLAIVEFGANDFLRGISPERTRSNLDQIMTELRRCQISVLLASMEAPRFLGAFAVRCDAVYADLGRQHCVPVVPFFPKGVLGASGFTLPDRIIRMPQPFGTSWTQCFRRSSLPLAWRSIVRPDEGRPAVDD